MTSSLDVISSKVVSSTFEDPAVNRGLWTDDYSYLAPYMVWKKIFRIVLLSLLVLIVALLLFVAFSIAPVNRTPASEFSSYEDTMKELKDLDSVKILPAQHGFYVGYSKVNLTPVQRTALAGYGNRKGKLFSGVHDSIYVRALVVDNGAKKIAIVSADLLIIPPTVTELLDKKLSAIGFSLDNTYLGATHTHNSIGNWGEGATRFIYGGYQDSIVQFIADKIVTCIKQASSNKISAQLKSGSIPVPQAVDNRLIDGGPEDSLLRVIEIRRSDSTKLLFMSYTAHATCLFSRDLELSRDYPGKLVDTMEENGYDFAMFMAGAVGSHGCNAPEGGVNCIDWMAKEISKTFFSNRLQLKFLEDTSSLAMIRIPLALSDPQVKIAPTWKVRSWLFRSAFGEYPVYLTGLRLGEVIMLGSPADFSGEFNPSLDSLAATRGVRSITTSFNGGYIGYLTPQKRYDVDHYETQLMNWYAPGTGEYVEKSLEQMLNALAH